MIHRPDPLVIRTKPIAGSSIPLFFASLCVFAPLR